MIKRYCKEDRSLWDCFIEVAKNGFFLFTRDYMDYHSSRFLDHSLLFYDNDTLVAILPANEKEKIMYSHGGLTYGGFIVGNRMSIVHMGALFKELMEYLRTKGFQSFVYKSIPFIFHKLPAQEDLYWLFRFHGVLYRREVNSVIDLSQRVSYSKGTKSNLSKARKNELEVVEAVDFGLFMSIQEDILKKKYNTRPTHTATEIGCLAKAFPNNIKLHLVYKDASCLGGTILFITDRVVHTQYIGITDEGKDVGALDLLIDKLITDFRATKQFFSFGISTEQGGTYLNENLARNKESFGARTTVNDSYKVEIL